MKYLRDEALTELSGELAMLLHAGLDIAGGLAMLAEDREGPDGELLTALRRDAEEGLPLSECMERSGAFPPEVCAQVRCGERTGRLEETLSAMAESGESRLRLVRQLRSALLYPSILFLLMLLVIGVLLIRVLPVFEEVYASLGGGMTGLAGGLLRLGEGLAAALPWLAPILAVLAALGLAFAGSQRFREEALRRGSGGRWGDRGVSRKLQDARIAQSLSLGLRSGLSGEEALALAAPQCAPAAGERCHRAEKLLAEGLGFAEALRQGEALPPAACAMLALGIRSGSGDTVIREIARRLTEEGENALREKAERVEPALVLVASVMVGIILLAVMLPLLRVMSALG